MTALICQCGCNNPIQPLPGHRFRSPRYIKGHAMRDPRVRASFAADALERQKALYPHLPEYRCQCGCDQIIPPTPSHLKRIPKYIQSHYLKLGTSSRIDKLREAKLRTRTTPPDGWTPPSGVCECGCGLATSVSKTSKPERNEYIGYYVRFQRGHHSRVLKRRRDPSWDGGRIAGKDGYVRVYKPAHPTANRDGYVLEHRYVYETTRNVTLPRTVLVHHINGDKADNRPENLTATTRRKHVDVHSRAGAIIAAFFDDKLMFAVRDYVRRTGELPDITTLSSDLFSSGQSTIHATRPDPDESSQSLAASPCPDTLST